MQDLRKQMARGAAWMLLFKFLDRGIGFLSTLVLARVLAPENFGVVAMAMSFIALLELLGAFGFDAALIQRAEATPAHFNTAWTFNVIIGTVIAALLLIFAGPFAAYYQHPELAPVIRVLALGIWLQGFANIGTVAFRKELDFRKEFLFLLSKRMVTFPVTIVLALTLRNYWALVIGVVSGRALELFISYRLHPYRPRLELSAAHDLLNFSKWLLLLNMLNFAKDRAHDFVVGRMVGARALGIFNVTLELASLPGSEMVAPINRAIYPAYAKMGSDLAMLRREYLSVMSIIVLLTVPGVAGIAAIAKLVVPIALGPQWLDAVPILQLLAFFGITQVMQSNAYSLYLATGRGKTFTWILGVQVVCLVPMLILCIRWRGLQGAAYAYLFTAAIVLPVTFAVISRLLSLRITSIVANIWRPLLAAACMYGVVMFLLRDVESTAPIASLISWLIISVLMGAVTYVASVLLFWLVAGRPPGAESIVLAKVRGVFARNQP